MFRRVAACLVVLALGPVAWPGVVLTDIEAPEWQVSEWIDGDPGALADHRGRVVLIHFFQLWCPVTNDFTVPLFQRWSELYGARDDVLIVGIHTVFEGFDVQTPEALRAWIAERGITYPVGLDDYADDEPTAPVTMRLYKTEGTPQVAIVDKHGKLRFFHFARFDPYVVEGLVERLLKEVGPQPGRAKPTATRPDPASGRYRVTLAQTSKTCGRLTRPLTLDMELTIVGTELAVRSRQAFAGMNDLQARFDPATSRFESRAARRIVEQGAPVDLNLLVTGALQRGTDPAAFEYTFTLEKSSTNEELNCRIEGRGKGTKVDPGRQR